MSLYTMTIAYNKFSILEQSLLNLLEKTKYENKKHLLINNLYPEEDPKKLESFCYKHGIEYLCFNKNIGLFNAMYETKNLCTEEDYIIFHEGNNLIIDEGFDCEMIKAYEELKKDDMDIMVTLANEFSHSLKKFEKNNIVYSIENDGEKKITKKPKGFPYGGTNLTKKTFVEKISSFYKNINFYDPYISYPREKREIYILRSHSEISHVFYKNESINYKIYKMLVIFVNFKKSFEDFLKLKETDSEYIYFLINALNEETLKYIGYDGKLE